jgi:NTE family protein
LGRAVEATPDRPTETAIADSPARLLPGEADAPPSDGVGLCLSGGGYRAMLFHLGALWRLNEASWLRRLDRVSSVSGGSVSAGALALAWDRLGFEGGVATNFIEAVVEPVRNLADHTIDTSAVLRGALGPGSIAERAAAAYREHLFGRATLQDLPAEGEGPRFVFNATSVQSGALWRFSRTYMADWRVGRIADPSIELASAVAASAAFPPVLSPLTLDLSEEEWITEPGNHLTDGDYRRRAVLSDGGVYDNLGLEAAWKRCRTILISDGGGALAFDDDPDNDWPRHLFRVLGVIDGQVRALRKRQAIAAYQNDDRDGAYWGIRTQIGDYRLPDALPAPPSATLALAQVPTRLAALEHPLQERLINWGYAVCDAAMRAHVDPALPAPSAFPYPRAGIEPGEGEDGA